jgi:hypothetical protein
MQNILTATFIGFNFSANLPSIRYSLLSFVIYSLALNLFLLCASYINLPPVSSIPLKFPTKNPAR